MTITMQNIERLTLAEIEEFLEGSRSIGFSVEAGQSYGFIERVLKAQGYRRLDRRCKGGRLFLIKVTGLSRAQDEHRCCSARSLHCWSKGRGLCAGRAGSVGDVTAIGREQALALNSVLR